MDTITLPKAKIPEIRFSRHQEAEGIIPPWFSKEIICWYDPKRQGCTNENMSTNPVLKDLSGNGFDLSAQNFAWTKKSGISVDNGLIFDGVGDMAYCLDFIPDLTDFTIICYRDNQQNTTGCLASNVNKGADGAFIFERFNPRAYYIQLHNTELTVDKTPYIGKYMTYMHTSAYGSPDTGTKTEIASNKPWPKSLLFSLGCISANLKQEYFRGTIYSFMIFGRTLSDSEIMWIRQNLIK